MRLNREVTAMIDLDMLSRGSGFSLHEGTPRLALVHHGFRANQIGFADARQDRFTDRYASLGLLNLARSAQADYESKRIPHRPEFRYFDEDHYADDAHLAEGITEWLRPAEARFVLVSLYSLAFERTAKMLAMLDPTEVCIVIGGAHPTMAPRADFAHVVVRGEGGAALRHILTELLEPSFGQGPEARGICFTRGGESHMSPPAFDRSLATIPAPAFRYDLTRSPDNSVERVRVRWWKSLGSRPQIYICTQSCRSRCSFCSTYIIHGNLVSRPVSLVSADLDYVIDELGHDSIEFHDDDLLQHDELDDLLDCLGARGVPWSCNARAEFMDSEIAGKLYRAGCRKVFLGIESLNQRTLDYYRKGTTVEMNQNAVRALDTVGIGVVCGFIIGAPHDTVDSIVSDIDRVLELPIVFLSSAILTPDIGTAEFSRAKKRIPLLNSLGDEGTRMNIRPRPDLFGTETPYGLPTVCEAVSKKQLNELYALANCSFFLKASSVARIARLTPADRMEEAEAWCSVQLERARELAESAELDVVRARAAELLAARI
ncbi:B12-binding domain-containing radical SAM protein [Streptomyces olivoreticuli]|uniref:B12-binding domain-containing radical SAM protein n=1 Tax=Streptomyces olivoreticuli TaxID=68246 RepID=UPI000E2732D1|nr:radical SAM protein [Streptomyces olivoreticuli]